MNLFNNLSTLESAGLIQVAKVEPDLEYLFRHSLVQEAAYASLLESDRKRLHLAVADAIESLYPDRRKELAAILGYHLKEAGQDIRALSYFLIAGDEALSTYANQEAEIQYRSALELACCSGPEIARLYSGLGESLYRQGRYDESLDAFRLGISVYQSLSETDDVARLYSRLGRVMWYAGRRPEGLRICQEGLELVKATPDGPGKAMLIHETARAYYFNGNSEKALPLCKQALSLAERYGDVYEQADTLATLGLLSSLKPEESLEALRKAVELAETNGFMQVAMRAHINLGTMTRMWMADNDAALIHYRRSAELGRMRGVASEELLGLTSYVGCLFSPGRIKEIEAEMPNVEALLAQIPNPKTFLVSVRFMKAALVNYKGEWHTALSDFWQCLADARQEENKESMIGIMDHLSWILLEMDRWGEMSDLNTVDELLQEASQLITEDNSNERIWLYPRLTMLNARQGKLFEARQWQAKLLDTFETRHSAWDEILKAECEAEIALAEKNWNEAIEAIEKINVQHVRFGFRSQAAVSLLIWADLLIRRGRTEDLELARAQLLKAMAEFTAIEMGHYPEIAQQRLDEINARQRAQSAQNVQLTRELKKARQVQKSLLPENPPVLSGWEISVLLEPAHETSGDFYDFLVLPDGNTGLVIADVTDKGTGAALYMALSRSLWRTFAVNHPSEPEQTMAETNQRILTDTHGGLFITLLYGILDPKVADFEYCNAGHLPGLLLRQKDGSVEQLERTGIPLGVLEDTSWERKKYHLQPGDTLVLYTDGITEAENQEGADFGMERLIETLKLQHGKTAGEIRDTLRQAVKTWAGGADQSDDITLLVLARGKKRGKR